MNLRSDGGAMALMKAMVRAEGQGNSTKVAIDTLMELGFVVVPVVATQDMLSAWTRQHTPGERPTLQQRWQRAIRKRPR